MNVKKLGRGWSRRNADFLVKYILEIGTLMCAEERGFFGKEYFGNRDADERGGTQISW